MSNPDHESPDDEIDQVISYIFDGAPPQPEAAADEAWSILPALRQALLEMHLQNIDRAIRFPTDHGAFADDLLATIPPVVPDANRLRDDVLYSCGHDRRTVLINAANAGLLRLFCAQHVLDEMVEHSGRWTNGTEISQAEFLERWLTEYLPLIRVVEDSEIPPSLLSPDELQRLEPLRSVDPDDIPSATLALTLGAFYLSNDRAALAAVYGANADLSEHETWLEVLRAGGNSGELGQMLQIGTALVVALAQGASQGVTRLWERFGLLGVLPIPALAFLLFRRMKPETKTNVASGFWTFMAAFVEIVGEYQSGLRRLERASAPTPSWESLAGTNDPTDVLARTCLFTLARVGRSNLSAKELREILPSVPVPHGETKVREALRTEPYFYEAWTGRWQVGAVALPVRRLQERQRQLADGGAAALDTGG